MNTFTKTLPSPTIEELNKVIDGIQLIEKGKEIQTIVNYDGDIHDLGSYKLKESYVFPFDDRGILAEFMYRLNQQGIHIKRINTRIRREIIEFYFVEDNDIEIDGIIYNPFINILSRTGGTYLIEFNFGYMRSGSSEFMYVSPNIGKDYNIGTRGKRSRIDSAMNIVRNVCFDYAKIKRELKKEVDVARSCEMMIFAKHEHLFLKNNRTGEIEKETSTSKFRIHKFTLDYGRSDIRVLMKSPSTKLEDIRNTAKSHLEQYPINQFIASQVYGKVYEAQDIHRIKKEISRVREFFNEHGEETQVKNEENITLASFEYHRD
jgi:hypothetical protein